VFAGESHKLDGVRWLATCTICPDVIESTGRSVTGCAEFGERQRAPAIAPRAVRGELMPMLEQTGEGAEVDHGTRVG